MSKFIVIRGPLGIGKSTISRILTERLGGSLFSIDKVLSDAGLDRVEGEGIPLRNFLRANEIIIPSIRKTLSHGRSVIVEGNFYHREQIEHLLSAVVHKSNVFTLKAPVEVCIKRDADRRVPLGEDSARAVHMMVSRFDSGIVIEVANLNVDQLVGRIIKKLD